MKPASINRSKAVSDDDASHMIGISRTQLHRLINPHELSLPKLGQRTLIDRHTQRAAHAGSAKGAMKEGA